MRQVSNVGRKRQRYLYQCYNCDKYFESAAETPQRAICPFCLKRSR